MDVLNYRKLSTPVYFLESILAVLLIQFFCLNNAAAVTNAEGRLSHLHHKELQNKQHLAQAKLSSVPQQLKNNIETHHPTKRPSINRSKQHPTISQSLYFSHSTFNRFWNEGTTNVTSHIFCPVSLSTNLMNKTHHYQYPMDVFQPLELGAINTSQNVQTCLEYDFYTNETFWEFKTIPHICPINVNNSTLFCPVTKQNIYHAVHTEELFWPKSYSFCDFKSIMSGLAYADPINVFVFGMSTTTGISAQGCKSFPLVDWDANDKDWLLKSNACAWPHYLEMWLQSISKVKVNVYNLASPGATSLYTAQKFNSVLKSKNAPSTITSRDIVLVDFSTTDVTLLSPKDPRVVESGMHAFIKQLRAHYSTPKQTPKVIILETEMNYKFSSTIGQQYINVAKHYGFHFWSLSNAVHSGYSAAQRDNSSSDYLLHVDYLKNNKAYRHDNHPPWFIHLYMADLLSALFVYEIHLCRTNGSVSGSNIYDRNVAIFNHSEVNLPIANDILVCNESVTPLLSISYDAVIRNETVIGSFELGDYWKLTTDLKGRGGFIRSLDDTDRFATHDNATLEFYFDAFTEVSTMENDSVVNNGHYLRRQLSSVHQKQYMLSLTYLSSYVNVGVVDVYICNQYMTTIDALWTDKKVSLPTIKNIVFNHTQCLASSGTRNSVQIKHRIQLNDKNSGTIASFGVDKEPKYKQMFKITSIDICQL